MKKCGDIMEQLSHLKNLTSVALDNFEADGRGWVQLAFMTNLKTVQGFIGTPNYVWKLLTNLQILESKYDKKKLDDFMDVVPHLTNLESLNIRTPNDLDSPFLMFTAAHTRLTFLEIEADYISRWNEGSENLHSIKSFTISSYVPDKSVVQPISLRHMTDLESLCSCFPIRDLNSTKIQHLYGPSTLTERRFFPKMEGLLTLTVSAEENMEYLSIFTLLESLSISGGENSPTDQRYSFLGNIASTKLNYLYLNGLKDQVSFGHLTNLTSLETLYLYNTLGDYNIVALKNLTLFNYQEYDHSYEGHDTSFAKAIEQLDKLRQLRWVSPHAKGVTVNISNLPNLENLTLWSDANFIGLHELTKLTHLEMCPMTASDNFYIELPYLANLTNLRSLVCEKESDFLQYVTALKMLDYLRIGCFHHEEDLLLLTSLTRLTSLAAEGNIQEELKGIYLTKLTTLQTLRWRQTTPEIVAEIQTLPNLVSFVTW